MTSRATIVIATDAMMVLPTSALERSRSSRTIAMRGAMPNQPKKARKKAAHVMWNVRICMLFRLNKSIRDDLFRIWAVSIQISLGIATSPRKAAMRGIRFFSAR